MVDDSRKLSISYSSELIPPPEWMSTLAVFYDEIWLPYPYMIEIANSPNIPSIELEDLQRSQFLKAFWDFARKYTKWKDESRVLFDEKI